MKTHEKILISAVVILAIGCATGWIFWSIERGNGIANLEAYRRLGELYQESGIIIDDLKATIENGRRELEQYQSAYRREYNQANEALQVIIGENQTAGSEIERIKATISKLKKLTNYYFDNFGSDGLVARPLSWTILEE